MPKHDLISGTRWDYGNSKMFILGYKSSGAVIGFRTYPHRNPTDYNWNKKLPIETNAIELMVKGMR